MDKTYMLNRLIHKRRLELGMSRNHLATLLGYSHQAVYMMEKEKMKVPEVALKKVCRALLMDRNLIAKTLVNNYAEKVCKILNLRNPGGL